MGNCVSGGSSNDNVFKVKNINSSRHLVQRGLMEVTNTELVYVDSTTKEEWLWPLKYLRRYGCDGDFFTFEAGRKCAGGEGLFCFSTKKASIVFELVARNINRGAIPSAGKALIDSEPQASDRLILHFPQEQKVSPSSRSDRPSYTNLDVTTDTNLDLMGNPLPNGGLSSSSNPDEVSTDTGKIKTSYGEVVFEKPTDEHPKPLLTTNRVSYTQIDFELRVLRMPSHTGRTSSTSTNSASGYHQRRRPHQHIDGHSSRRGRSGSGNGRDTTTQPKTNYYNICIATPVGRDGEAATSSDLNAKSRSIRQNGHPMRSHAHSISGDSIQKASYLEVIFPDENDASSFAPTSTSEAQSVQSQPLTIASAVVISTTSPEPSSAIAPSIIHQHIPEELVVPHCSKSSKVPVVDMGSVCYKDLDFPTMVSLSELKTQREQEVEKERGRRQKDKAVVAAAAAAANKKKKKKTS